MKDLELPLFPGYLFCRFDYGDRRVPIVTTPGDLGLVGEAGCPAPVDPSEIDAVRRIIDSGLAAEPWPYVREGSTVRIDHGSLAGIEGVVVEVKKRYRLVVSVTLLQRSVGVEIDREWVSAVSPLPFRPAPLPRRASAF
jgi:transcription antitermination factor NusG